MILNQTKKINYVIRPKLENIVFYEINKSVSVDIGFENYKKLITDFWLPIHNDPLYESLEVLLSEQKKFNK